MRPNVVGRAFHQSQHPHFRLRNLQMIDADLNVRAYLRKERAGAPRLIRLHQCEAANHTGPPLHP
jgi:hypothetical protein